MHGNTQVKIYILQLIWSKQCYPDPLGNLFLDPNKKLPLILNFLLNG